MSFDNVRLLHIEPWRGGKFNYTNQREEEKNKEKRREEKIELIHFSRGKTLMVRSEMPDLEISKYSDNVLKESVLVLTETGLFGYQYKRSTSIQLCFTCRSQNLRLFAC